MLNSFPHYNLPHASASTSLCRSTLNSTLPLNKCRRSSFSPSTSLLLPQPTFADYHDSYYPSAPASAVSNDNPGDIAPPTANFFPESKADTNLSFLDNLDPASSADHAFAPKNPPEQTTPSTFQCVRIIRRNDSAPVAANPNGNPPRVVRVIRLSNPTSRQLEQPAASNVYIVRKSDVTPTVHINPAVQHVIAKNNASNADENNHINKFYGSTISIFGLEFTVVSNEAHSTDQCASLVQNMTDAPIKSSAPSTNKVSTRRSIRRCRHGTVSSV